MRRLSVGLKCCGGLPPREEANVFGWFTRFADDRGRKHQYPAGERRTKIADRIEGEPQLLLLSPRARSLLR